MQCITNNITLDKVYKANVNNLYSNVITTTNDTIYQQWIVNITLQTSVLPSHYISQVILKCTTNDDMDINITTNDISFISNTSIYGTFDISQWDNTHCNVTVHVLLVNGLSIDYSDTISLNVYDINDVSIINETTYQCGFVHGSIALGCHIVMVSSDGHNYTINISRLQSTGSCITDIQPGHYTLYAYDIDYNGFIPHLPAITIPNIIIICTESNGGDTLSYVGGSLLGVSLVISVCTILIHIGLVMWYRHKQNNTTITTTATDRVNDKGVSVVDPQYEEIEYDTPSTID
jgi:hypothetical protein